MKPIPPNSEPGAVWMNFLVIAGLGLALVFLQFLRATPVPPVATPRRRYR
jgi:hypothetical protein